MRSRLLFTLILGAGLTAAVAVFAAAGSPAASPALSHFNCTKNACPGQSRSPSAMMTRERMESCPTTGETHGMLAQRHQMDARLQKLVNKMHMARGKRAKLAAMQKVIDELVAQRKELADTCMSMQARMVRDMMMKHGMQNKAACPMMGLGTKHSGDKGMAGMHSMHGSSMTPMHGPGQAPSGDSPIHRE